MLMSLLSAPARVGMGALAVSDRGRWGGGCLSYPPECPPPSQGLNKCLGIHMPGTTLLAGLSPWAEGGGRRAGVRTRRLGLVPSGSAAGTVTR